MIADFCFTFMRSIQFHFMCTHFVRPTQICRDKLDSNLNGKSIKVLWAPNQFCSMIWNLVWVLGAMWLQHYNHSISLAQVYTDVISNWMLHVCNGYVRSRVYSRTPPCSPVIFTAFTPILLIINNLRSIFDQIHFDHSSANTALKFGATA